MQIGRIELLNYAYVESLYVLNSAFVTFMLTTKSVDSNTEYCLFSSHFCIYFSYLSYLPCEILAKHKAKHKLYVPMFKANTIKLLNHNYLYDKLSTKCRHYRDSPNYSIYYLSCFYRQPGFRRPRLIGQAAAIHPAQPQYICCHCSTLPSLTLDSCK